MIRPVLLWPDPVLSQVCDKITGIYDDIRTLAADMLDTMYDAPGRGLAAPQIGVPLRLLAMDATWKDGNPAPRIMVNPELVWQSDSCVTGPESCLSLPGITADIERASSVRAVWTDLDGRKQTETLAGFEAICFQHELDHLDGIVTLDRVTATTRSELIAAYAP